MTIGWMETYEERIKNALECPPQDKALIEVSDDTVDGLKLRVRRSGSAAWYCYLFDTIAGKKTYQKLGDYQSLSLSAARGEAIKRAQRVSMLAVDGVSYIAKLDDDKAERALDKRRNEKTLRRCLDDYVSDRADLSDAAIKDYRLLITSKKNCPEILDQPVSQITKEWFFKRFAEIFVRGDTPAWRWRTAMLVILRHAEELEPNLFPDGFPILDKSKYGIQDKRRKSDRIDLTHLPALRLRLRELDDYDRDFILIMLLSGMRAGAIKLLRYDMTCNRSDAVGRKKWEEHGMISVFAATQKRAPSDLVASDLLRGIIQARFVKYGHLSPWLFWSRRNNAKPEQFANHSVDDRWIFDRLDLHRNTGNGLLSSHDLRRTFSYIARNVLRIDHVIVHDLMLHSKKHLSVADGYVSATPDDILRASNEISENIQKWMNSTPEEIENKFGNTKKAGPLPTFQL